jgi:hypothetical protein
MCRQNTLFPTEDSDETRPDANQFDVFSVHQRFAINDPSGCIHHASRNLLLSSSTSTGIPDYQDIEEARNSLNRWLQLNQHLK